MTNSFDSCVQSDAQCEEPVSAGLSAPDLATHHVGLVRHENTPEGLLSTSIAVGNPTPVELHYTVSVIDPDHQVVCEADRSLPAHGSEAVFWNQLCGLEQYPNDLVASLVLDGNVDFSAIILTTLNGLQLRSTEFATPR